jgi:hypothetical protein
MISKDKLKHWVWLHWGYIFYVAVFLFYSICLYQCGRRSVRKPENNKEIKRDTITSVITDNKPVVTSLKPLYFYKVVRKKDARTAKDTIYKDSISLVHDTLSIPITQQLYTGSNYKAYVSGYHQSLDSINVVSRTVTNTITKYRNRSRWNIGVSAGYGINHSGLTPFIGIGVTWNIFK